MLSQDAEMLNYSHAMPRACGQAEREAVAEKTASLAVSWRDMEILALLLITIGAFFYFMNVHIGEQSYELQQIRTEIISLEKGNEAARLEVARATPCDLWRPGTCGRSEEDPGIRRETVLQAVVFVRNIVEHTHVTMAA